MYKSPLVLALVNVLTIGSHPVTTSAVKLASGCGLMFTSAVAVPAQPFSVSAENETVAVINSPVVFSHVCVGA